MADREIIVKFLEKLERRIRANRLFHELTLGLSLFLAFPIILKICDLVVPLPGAIITVSITFWLVCLSGYFVRRLWQKGTLGQAAESIDARANLQDEIKTAFWFINNPRSSEWVEAQIQRAAKRTHSFDMERLYPRSVPRALYIAATMILVFVSLNFVPLRSNRNWLALQAASQQSILDESEGLLRKAELLDKSEQAQRIEEILRQLREGKIDADEAARLLEQLEKQLNEDQVENRDLQAEPPPEAPPAPLEGLIDPYAEFREGNAEGNEDQQNLPTPVIKLQVQLEKEKLQSTPDEEVKPEDLEASKWSSSKLGYRGVRSTITQAEKDVLPKDRIPWEYRPLVKDYFQAIRPPEKN